MMKSFSLAPALLFTLALGCSSSSSDKTHQGQDLDSGTQLGPEPVLPAAPDTCPTLETGTVTVQGKAVKMWVGQQQADKKGPILLYWHGTGSTADEVIALTDPRPNPPPGGTSNPVIDEIVSEGGVVASFTDTVGGTAAENTGNNVWYTTDFNIADAIVACAARQLNIDTRRIYAAGCSAGGLESGTMAIMRSSYIAAAIPNSGGHILPGGVPFEDPAHIPAVMTVHGTMDKDKVIIDFETWSHALDQQVVGAGGHALDCTTPNGHCMILLTPIVINPATVIAAQWQFLKDHPFGLMSDPYANGLPSVFPSFCANVTVGGDQ
jgi:hypothetical protein